MVRYSRIVQRKLRYCADLVVGVHAPGREPVSSRTENLSEGGVLLRGTEFAPVGSDVLLRLVHSDREGEVRGRIVRLGEGTTGVRFSELSPAFRTWLFEVLIDLQRAGAKTIGRRIHERGVFSLTAAFGETDREGTRPGTLANLGLGGARIATEEPPPLGARIRISFPMPEVAGIFQARFQCVGTVAHSSPGGFGLRFHGLAESDIDALGALLVFEGRGEP